MGQFAPELGDPVLHLGATPADNWGVCSCHVVFGGPGGSNDSVQSRGDMRPEEELG